MNPKDENFWQLGMDLIKNLMDDLEKLGQIVSMKLVVPKEIVENEKLGSVRISAQSYLEKYYGKFGFVKCSEEYLEDNIPHVEMLRD